MCLRNGRAKSILPYCNRRPEETTLMHHPYRMLCKVKVIIFGTHQSENVVRNETYSVFSTTMSVAY